MAREKSSLVTVLTSFDRASSLPQLGERKSMARVPTPGASEILRQDLQRIVRSNEVYFRICVGILLILFAGACLFVYSSRADPKNISAVFGATGITVMGLVRQMARLWKEKVNSDLLLVLTVTLSPADLNRVVKTILQVYLKSR